MNTKQILYNALQDQLKIKESEYHQYLDNVYNVEISNLDNEVKEWFEDNLEYDFGYFKFGGDRIKLHHEGYKSTMIEIKTYFRSEPGEAKVVLEWYGGNLVSRDTDEINNIISLGEIASKLSLIEHEFVNNWFVKFKTIEQNERLAAEEFSGLKSALLSLKNEIKNDSVEQMKQIGFEIKSFKPYYRCNWNSNDEYVLEKNEHLISLQYGRSRYENTYVNGFKVLDKSGNKYIIEIFKDNMLLRKYSVLEKKFDDFVKRVSSWENEDADYNKERAEERFNEHKD